MRRRGNEDGVKASFTRSFYQTDLTPSKKKKKKKAIFPGFGLCGHWHMLKPLFFRASDPESSQGELPRIIIKIRISSVLFLRTRSEPRGLQGRSEDPGNIKRSASLCTKRGSVRL